MTVRRLVLAALAALAAATALAAPASAAPPALDFQCAPQPAGCAGWYRGPVTLTWDYNGFLAQPTGDGNCLARTFTADTAGTKAWCEVIDIPDMTSTTKHTVTIKLDATPPAISAAVPERPPDHGNWYTRPAAFALQGSDAISGLAACDTVTYGGPDGPEVGVGGSCRDVAGNVGSRSFPLNYDATPPQLAEVTAAAGDGFAQLSWRASPDTARVEVTRSPGPAGPVFNGSGDGYRDNEVKNGVRYGYTVTAFDQAGNSRQAATSALPVALPLVAPPRNARVSGPPRLRWKRVRRASYYNVQVFRGKRKILSAWPRGNDLKLRRTWHYGGRPRRLVPGSYRWYVWPGYGQRSARRYGRMLGQSKFVVARR